MVRAWLAVTEANEQIQAALQVVQTASGARVVVAPAVKTKAQVVIEEPQMGRLNELSWVAAPINPIYMYSNVRQTTFSQITVLCRCHLIKQYKQLHDTHIHTEPQYKELNVSDTSYFNTYHMNSK